MGGSFPVQQCIRKCEHDPLTLDLFPNVPFFLEVFKALPDIMDYCERGTCTSLLD